MDNKSIIYLKSPTNDTDAATKKYVDDSIPDTSSFLKKDGSVAMTGDLNLGNKKKVGLATPVSNTDAATKEYVDDNAGGSSSDLSGCLKKDGSVSMTGELNVNRNKITKLANPTNPDDAATKQFTETYVREAIKPKPSHFTNEFAYLMSSGSQWTDETDGGNSFFILRIGDLSPSKGNFHNYNHKVIFTRINKNRKIPLFPGSDSTGRYKYKMGINFYRLIANPDYTLCMEILNTDHTLWNKTQISVDKGS